MHEIRPEAEKEAIRKAILDYYHEGHVQYGPELYRRWEPDE